MSEHQDFLRELAAALKMAAERWKRLAAQSSSEAASTLQLRAAFCEHISYSFQIAAMDDSEFQEMLRAREGGPEAQG